MTETLLQSGASAVPFELQALSKAENYQRWVFRTVEPFLGSRILEVGAGIGNMSRWLPARERLILTESEPTLLRILQSADPGSRADVRQFNFMSDSLDPYISERLDTIISFNVLEHVENDGEALRRLCDILRKGKGNYPKRLITFVPAHDWAYGGMDRSFGHYRRYSAKAFAKLANDVAPEAKVYMRYFNLFGLLGWWLNGRVFQKESIGVGSIKAFEILCPFLSHVDDFAHQTLRVPLGQSLLTCLAWKAPSS